MVKLIPIGGENLFKALLTPFEKTPEILLNRKKEFIMLAGFGVAFLFAFKLLMWNIIPKIFQAIFVGIVAALLALAMFPLIKLQNDNAKNKKLSGFLITFCLLLIILLVL